MKNNYYICGSKFAGKVVYSTINKKRNEYTLLL